MPTYAALLLYTVTPAWLALSRAERRQVGAETIRPILDRYAGRVQASFFDAEAFTARCSDFAVFRFHDPRDFYHLIEALRDTALFGVPYLSVNDLILGLQNSFQEYEASGRSG